MSDIPPDGASAPEERPRRRRKPLGSTQAPPGAGKRALGRPGQPVAVLEPPEPAVDAEAAALAEAAPFTKFRWRDPETGEEGSLTPVMFHSPRWALIDRDTGDHVYIEGRVVADEPEPGRLCFFRQAQMAWKADPDVYKGMVYVDLTDEERAMAEPGCGDVHLATGLWTRAWLKRHTLPADAQAEVYRAMAAEETDMGEVRQLKALAAEYEAQARIDKAEERARGLHPVELDWDDWDDDPPHIKFLIPGWLPDGVVTLFAAHGGTGKSYLSLYIALCLATGRNPFSPDEMDPPERIERVKVYLYSAEDSMPVLQFRLARYMRLLGIGPEELKGWLKVVDATESNNVLFSASRDVEERVTARMEWLRREVADFGADLLIFDNASDALDGNENDRAVVRQFLTALKSIAPAVLLLAHVDAVSSMADVDKAKGYSGSTGWHNSVRSRWFMARDADSDRIVLKVPKANYAKGGTEAEIAWDDIRHLFRVLEVRDGRVNARDNRDRLLGLLAQVLDSGKNVSPAPQSSNNLFRSLQPLDGFPRGLTSKGVHAELARWLQAGLVRVEEYPKANRNGTAERLAMTGQGRAVIEAGRAAAPG